MSEATDLAARLRGHVHNYVAQPFVLADITAAADLIERQKAEIERLRGRVERSHRLRFHTPNEHGQALLTCSCGWWGIQEPGAPSAFAAHLAAETDGSRT